MRTFGLGGDSEVALEDGGLVPRIRLGPRRLVPLALAGMAHGEAVAAELERQLRASRPSRMDGRFALRTGIPERMAAGLSSAEAGLYGEIGAAPRPLDQLLFSNSQNATLNRLVARGLVRIAGFTPSDAAYTKAGTFVIATASTRRDSPCAISLARARTIPAGVSKTRGACTSSTSREKISARSSAMVVAAMIPWPLIDGYPAAFISTTPACT